MEVVQLRSEPLVNDIPAQLRALADRIESGEQAAEYVLAIIPVEDDWPSVYGWGNRDDYSEVELLEIAKAWFISNIVRRNSSGR